VSHVTHPSDNRSSASAPAAPIPAAAFIGRQNSGKTTLLVKLIATLSARGVRVATIKHHSHAGFEFDIEGKDSWRHRQAGSIHTIVAAPDQIASVRRIGREASLRQIIEMLAFESDVLGDIPHIILVEGYRHGELPSVELFRAGNPADEVRDLVLEGHEVIAVVTDIDRIAVQAQTSGLPVFSLEDIDPLAYFLTERFLTPLPFEASGI
jgi:molybdopterin-guanine dinucleotide biosynthesis protein MobB